jgi:hypothetical protein
MLESNFVNKNKYLNSEILKRYIYLNLIASDENMYLLLIVMYLLPLLWWVLLELGFRLFNSINDFDLIAVDMICSLNANVEYANKNILLNLSNHISNFHKIIFFIVLLIFLVDIFDLFMCNVF